VIAALKGSALPGIMNPGALTDLETSLVPRRSSSRRPKTIEPAGSGGLGVFRATWKT